MIHLITGEKGKGKTKVLISNANEEIKKAEGNIVYLDKSNKNIYELNNKIRLINVNDYLVSNTGEFLGFICGLVSQDHDLEKIFLDSFLRIAFINDNAELDSVLDKLNDISEKFGLEFEISISVIDTDIPDKYKYTIKVSL